MVTKEVQLFQAREEIADSVTLDGNEVVISNKIFQDANVEDADVNEIEVNGKQKYSESLFKTVAWAWLVCLFS